MEVSGSGAVQMVEPPDAVKFVPVRWNGVKIDLTQLARLRWIENLTVEEICKKFGKERTYIKASIRTLRKCGISELNLTQRERELIENQISREVAIYGGKNDVSTS